MLFQLCGRDDLKVQITSIIYTKSKIMKKGDKIRIIRMDDSNGKDQQARQMNGRVVTVKFIDGIGQIHLEESGLALIPGVDEYESLA